MTTKSSETYLSNVEWFRDVIDENVVLAFKSALECLGYFQGWIGEDTIEVYATKKGKYENISYHLVESLDDVDSVIVHGIPCTSMSQTVNDMLREIDSIDEQPLIEGLSAYYFENNESIEGLNISADNQATFSRILEEAIYYYND